MVWGNILIIFLLGEMNTLLLSLVKVEVLPLADVLSILNLGDKSACFINPLVPDCNLKYVFFISDFVAQQY